MLDSTRNQNQTRRILWVEDDYYHLKGLVKPLKSMGIEVVPARSVVEAQSLLVDWKQFSLIILDLIIPYTEYGFDRHSASRDDEDDIGSITKNGIALFDYIVEELGIDIPILLLSVVNNKEIIDRLLSKGANRLPTKLGITPQELAKKVIEIIENNSCNNHVVNE